MGYVRDAWMSWNSNISNQEYQQILDTDYIIKVNRCNY